MHSACFFYQVDSVAEEVERRKSNNDMVNSYDLFEIESPLNGFLRDQRDELYSKIVILHIICTGIHIWRGRPVAFGCYFGWCCKGFWGSSGALFIYGILAQIHHDLYWVLRFAPLIFFFWHFTPQTSWNIAPLVIFFFYQNLKQT